MIIQETMIIQGTVFSLDTDGLRLVSKQPPLGIILIYEGVDKPIQISLKNQDEIDKNYTDIMSEWIKSKKL